MSRKAKRWEDRKREPPEFWRWEGGLGKSPTVAVGVQPEGKAAHVYDWEKADPK